MAPGTWYSAIPSSSAVPAQSQPDSFGPTMTDSVPGGDGSGVATEGLEMEHMPTPVMGPRFPVVGIGASAGGLGAFSQVLAGLPPGTGMAFVLIQHLDPTHTSELALLLTKVTPMPVEEAIDGVLLEPDHIYVIPPNTVMVLAEGRLHLTPRESIPSPHFTIDHFFRSLASACDSRSVGVLLSGTGSDGTLGLAEIKAVGGITLAQDPRTAEQAGMPQSAIAYGCVDIVLSLSEIAQEIVSISHHGYLHATEVVSDHDLFLDEEEAYGRVLAMLTATSGVDFTHYRPSTIKRRILRRMALRSCRSLGAYLPSLKDSVGEVELLLKDVLINVTNFFRDQAVFAAITTTIFPELVKDRGSNSAIRIWVVGCSTGQEAYSLAISLIEFLEGRPVRPPIQIFATDISEPSLATARAGIYPESIESEVTPDRLRLNFTKVPEGYRINKSIRDLCVFAKHDATAVTPFSKIDLLSCRNMLIYLAPAMQARLISMFHYALNIPGYMVLGNSESTGRSSELFTVLDSKQRLYLKNPQPGRLHAPMFPAQASQPAGSEEHKLGTGGLTSPLADYQRAADRLLLGHYAPPGVLIDPEMTIIQFRGETADFLDHARGVASLNLLKMVPYAMAQTLKDAIADARQKNATVELLGVRFRNREVLREIDLRIFPIRPRGLPDGCMLVMFEPHRAGMSMPVSPLTGNNDHQSEMAAMRQELATANDHMKALIEENSFVTDELKLANNDANSSNEELRCTNEELQTAKEEVLSSNEELVTLNDELRNRNLDLTTLSNDLTNLLDSIDLPVLMLGGDLRLRRMTTTAEKVLHLVPSDIGRLIGDLNLAFANEEIMDLVTDVIRTQTAQEREVRGRHGRWFTVHINPYLAEGNRISGAVITLIDIDTLKGIQESLRKIAEFSRAIVETVRDPLVVLDRELSIDTANQAFCRLFALPRDAVVGKRIYDLNQGQWDIPELKRLLDDIPKTGSLFDNFEVTRDVPGIGRRSVLLNARGLESSEQPSRMIVLAISDITEQKRVYDDLKAASAELMRSNDELDHFASVASHDLQEPMRMIRVYSELLKRSLGDALDESKTKLLDMVIDGAKRMQDLIRSLLEYSRAGNQTLVTETMDLQAIIRAVTLNLDRMVHRAHATIDCGPMPSITGDPMNISRLFQNLIANALKFRSKDRPCVVTVRAVESEREWIFSVADTGIGIRSEDFDRIFRIFQRLHGVGEYTGNGIGLAACKKIVERHHGRIWVESQLGVGTTFLFSVPKEAAGITGKPT